MVEIKEYALDGTLIDVSTRGIQWLAGVMSNHFKMDNINRVRRKYVCTSEGHSFEVITPEGGVA